MKVQNLAIQKGYQTEFINGTAARSVCMCADVTDLITGTGFRENILSYQIFSYFLNLLCPH